MLRQTKLIQKILHTTDMEDCGIDITPAREKPYGADVDGPAFAEEWDYPSVIGMLLYLVNTRPDIQFAVHQCARFTHAPRDCHAQAVKRICRYLQGTKEKGLVFRPSTISDGKALKLDCYVESIPNH